MSGNTDRDYRLFQSFNTHLQSFTPILSDVIAFEKQLCAFIDYKLSSDNTSHASNRLSLVWLSLLYAILASGTQFRDVPHAERTSEASKYMKYSFQCLGYADYLSHPTVECLETLLVVGNVLQNLMKPQAAWILLGTTSRIGQSLGLHRKFLTEKPLNKDSKL